MKFVKPVSVVMLETEAVVRGGDRQLSPLRQASHPVSVNQNPVQINVNTLFNFHTAHPTHATNKHNPSQFFDPDRIYLSVCDL